MIVVSGSWDPPGDCGGRRSEVKDGEEDLHLQSVLLRVRSSPQGQSGEGSPIFTLPRRQALFLERRESVSSSGCFARQHRTGFGF